MSELDWKPTNDGKGSWCMVSDFRLVVKEKEHGWWWGVYEHEYDDLQDDGYESTEEAAKDAAEDAGLLL